MNFTGVSLSTYGFATNAKWNIVIPYTGTLKKKKKSIALKPFFEKLLIRKMRQKIVNKFI